MGAIQLVEYTDPYSVWCWGAEPVVRKVEYLYGDLVDVRVVMGGLFEDFTPMREYWARMSGGQWQDAVLAFLTGVAGAHRMPMDARAMMAGLEDSFRIGDHTLFVGRVLVVQAESEAFDQTWLLDDREMRPLHYLGIDRYAVLGERMQAELRTTDEGTVDLAETDEARERREEEEARERERVQREGEAG